MGKNPIFTFLVTALMITIAAPTPHAEDLFDTATASKHLEQGVALLKVKKYDAAIKEFEESASVNPDAEAYYYLGYAYYLKGRSGDEESRKKSRDYFAKAYEVDPSFTPTRYKTTETLQSTDAMRQRDQAQPPRPSARETLSPSQPTSTTAMPNP